MGFGDNEFDSDEFQGIQESGLNPNQTVQHPQRPNNTNYNQQSNSGAREARTEEINQGFSQPGQTIRRNANGQPVQGRPRRGMPQVRQQSTQQRQPNSQQQYTQQNQQYQQQQMQMRQMQLNQQYQQQQMQMQNQQMNQQMQNQQQRQGGGKGKFVIVAALLIAVIAVAVLFKTGKISINKGQVPVAENYEGSGKEALNQLQTLLNADTFDAVAIDNLIGSEEGDSYIAQEWAYVNGVKLREEYIQKVCNLVKFSYPMVAQMADDGTEYKDASGQTVQVESMMNNDESVTVTVPDYSAITSMMDADDDTTGRKYIIRMFESAAYKDTDYTWHDEMANLLMQYLCDLPEFPTREAQINIPVSNGKITDDSQLDDILFGNEEFHNMCAMFSQICVGWTGFKPEKYKTKEEQHNPEYDEWLDLFLKYFTEDGGTYDPATGEFEGFKNFRKGVSKWEPWFLRDDEDNFIRDENGEKIVNYYSVKKEDGTDWIQPSETILVDVWKTRQVEDPWVSETGIQYNVLGTNWIQNNYDGVGETVFRVGDGSKDFPAGIGTTIITKALCTDGKYHDVKVAVVGYWVNQDAIDYAEKFSTKNRGFTISSVISLITYEVQIENLEEKPIKLVGSEMSLCDDNSNISSRTGTMYGFTEEIRIQPHEKVLINDWAASTELEQKYVIWGKDFGRKYSMVYFNILAGTGYIPTYSAYQQFTGQSSIDEDVKVDVSEDSKTSSEGAVTEDSESDTTDTTEGSDTSGESATTEIQGESSESTSN